MLLLIPLSFAADLRLTLSARDYVGCSALGAATDTLYTELVAATDPSILPGSVPVRAADCLLTLYPTRAELGAVLLPWMSDPERAGLAMVVAARIDELPLELASSLATEAMKLGDEKMRGRLQTRLQASSRPEIRLIAQ